MDDWFNVHSFITSYLSAFEFAVSTEGDSRLREHYKHYVTSESCKLAEIPTLPVGQRLKKLNAQAEAVQNEFGKFKLLSDLRRRERENEDRERLRTLHSKAHKSYNGALHQTRKTDGSKPRPRDVCDAS